MSQGVLWTIVLVSGVLTLSMRLSFLLSMDKLHLPIPAQQALRFVPVAMLSALIAPALLFPGGELHLSLTNARLIAGTLAIVIAWRTRNVLLTIGAGMVCLLILQFFGPFH